MRLGAMNIKNYSNPDMWVSALQREGYRTSVFPADLSIDDETARQYGRVAEQQNIIIAEVGGWCNVLADSDRGTRKESMERSKRALYLADEVGARCAVNIAGSRGAKWDGPDARNLTTETYEMIVSSVREIIDEVKPRRTFYTLEPMPWMFPFDIETQRRLIRDIDRKALAIHFDPVNMIRLPELYYENGTFITSFIHEFGSLIKSVHAKDLLLRTDFTLHLEETLPGMGGLNYPVLLREIEQLDKDMPLIIEHLKSDNEYSLGAKFIRKIASEVNVNV
jgi:sugar phosphate isomerase/epimerase